MKFDPGLFAWTLVTFGVLYAMLAAFVFRPLRQHLDAREQVFALAREAAATARQAAERAEQQCMAHVDAARGQVRQLIADGHRQAEEKRRELRSSAREEADRMVEDARQEISREVIRSLDGLKPAIAAVSLKLSGEFLGERADPDQHTQLAADFVERLQKSYTARR